MRKTNAAFLNNEGWVLARQGNDGFVIEIERDRREHDDKFMRHLAQVVLVFPAARSARPPEPPAGRAD